MANVKPYFPFLYRAFIIGKQLHSEQTGIVL
jgi:hypothetical protein